MTDATRRGSLRTQAAVAVLCTCWLAVNWLALHLLMLWLEFSLTLADASPQAGLEARHFWKLAPEIALLGGGVMLLPAVGILASALRLAMPSIPGRNAMAAGAACTALAALLMFSIAAGTGGALIDPVLEQALSGWAGRLAKAFL